MAKILVVDDDQSVREILQKILKMTPHLIEEAFDGLDALEKAEVTDYELMIVDLRMPRLDGETLIRKIREIDDRISFIVVTGHGELEDGIRFLKEYQISDFLQKPLDNPFQLLISVASALEKQQLRVERESLLKEQQKKEINDKMNNFRGLLFKIMAHRIRTPANYIEAPVDLLLKQIYSKVTPENIDPWREKTEQFLKAVKNGSELLVNLFEKIHFYFDLTSGVLNPDLQEENISTMVDCCLKEAKIVLEAKNIKPVVSNLQKSPGPFICDRSLIKYAIKAILDNAVEQSPRDSIISITMMESEIGPVLSVQDQGPGIPLEEQENIFEPFSMEKTQNNLEDTLPLSLCMVKQIMLLHNSNITVESTPGEGAKFTLSLQNLESNDL